MSIEHFLVLCSIALTLIAARAYIQETLQGKTKPNRVTWLLWAIIPMISTVAALQAHANVWATLRIFLAGFLPLIVFLASFVNKQSFWKVTLFDGICGAFSILTIAVWIALDSPRMAILLSVIADGIALLPTLIKAWKRPDTETGRFYVINLIALFFIVPSIPVWNIENSAFQIYLFVANIVLIVAIYRKKWF
jgi:hypothetical protein